MLVKNPFRHYPRFTARVIRVDGDVFVQRGLAEAEMLYIPGEEGDIYAIAMVMQDAGHQPVAEKLWIDGLWQQYDEKVFNQFEKNIQKVSEQEESEQEESEQVKEIVSYLELEPVIETEIIPQSEDIEMDEDE